MTMAFLSPDFVYMVASVMCDWYWHCLSLPLSRTMRSL